jgi:hypothetical protein
MEARSREEQVSQPPIYLLRSIVYFSSSFCGAQQPTPIPLEGGGEEVRREPMGRVTVL